ncbi:MAG: phosphotransferase family protein [Chloroflexi bacterium]|nr:phosphotransferase family protein [Chloroflexota bacterium]
MTTSGTAVLQRDLELITGKRVTRFDPSPDGHSGFTYYVTLDDREAVLRLPPPGARPVGPADVARQGRIMRAVRAAGLPAPGILAMDAEPVLDGRSFVLMERVVGERIEQVLGRHSDGDIAEQSLATLRRLHEVPLGHSGIGEEAPKTLADEVEHWTWLIDRAPQELVEHAPLLAQALTAAKPEPEPEPALVHADYHYGNLLFSEPESGRCEVTAILDWEIAEIGAPLVDLGAIHTVGQLQAEVDGKMRRWLELDLPDVARLYGVAYEDARWYFALGMYKYAAIYGYNLMLHRRGKRPDAMYETLTGRITQLLDDGLALLD